MTLLIVSDYAKGTCSDFYVSQVLERNPSCKIFIDPKKLSLKQVDSCFLLKPNRLEFCDFVGISRLSSSKVIAIRSVYY